MPPSGAGEIRKLFSRTRDPRFIRRVPDAATQTLIEHVETAFRAAGWQFRRVEDQPVVESEFEAHHAKVPLHVQAFDELGIISVVARLSFNVSPAAKVSVSEALMRTNLSLNIGNFETDPDSGEVFFRATNVFPRGECEPSVIASLVRTAVVEMDRLTPFLAELERQPIQPIAALLAREDLLPTIGEPTSAA